MNERNSPSGLALRCTPHGEIIEVLRDDLGLTDGIEVGVPLTSLVDRASLGKLLNFLVEMRTRGSTSLWSLNVVREGRIESLSFAGTMREDEQMVFAAHTGTEAVNLSRRLLGEPSGKEVPTVVAPPYKSDPELFDELSRLNNELVNLHRELAKKNAELEKTNHRLQEAMAEIRTLRGYLPICMYCHKIRDDKENWLRLENYIESHSDARFSHSICPDCTKEHFGDLFEDEADGEEK